MNRTILYAQKRAELSKQRIEILRARAEKRKAPLRNALVVSLLSILLSLSAVTATTYAWFTDSVSNTGNKIQAGTLQIDFLMSDSNPTLDSYHTIANQTESIFSDNVIWEPGQTQIAYLAVENKGNLALKYNIVLDVNDMGTNDDLDLPMAGAFDFTIINQDSPSIISGWDEVKECSYNLLEIIRNQTSNPTAKSGRIIAAKNGVLDEVLNGVENERQYFAIVVHMKDNAYNAYQNGLINIDATIVATQVSAEEDGFGDNRYDDNVQFESIPEKHYVVPQKGQTIDEAFTQMLNNINTGDEIVLPVAKGENKLALPSLTNKEFTLVGSGDKETEIDRSKPQGEPNSIISMRNITLVGAKKDSNYIGFQHTSYEHYTDCKFTGITFFYASEMVFDNCVFEQDEYEYCFWTYGAKKVTFNNCVFNTQGKAAKIYNESKDSADVYNITFNNCEFNAPDGNIHDKPAIAVNSLGAQFNVVCNNCTQNNYKCNDTAMNNWYSNRMNDADDNIKCLIGCEGQLDRISVIIDGTSY